MYIYTRPRTKQTHARTTHTATTHMHTRTSIAYIVHQAEHIDTLGPRPQPIQHCNTFSENRLPTKQTTQRNEYHTFRLAFEFQQGMCQSTVLKVAKFVEIFDLRV